MVAFEFGELFSTAAVRSNIFLLVNTCVEVAISGQPTGYTSIKLTLDAHVLHGIMNAFMVLMASNLSTIGHNISSCT